MKIITSTANETFKNIKKLLEPKGTKRSQSGLCFGSKVVKDVITNHLDLVVEVIRTPKHTNPAPQIPETVLSEALFKTIDVFDTGSPAIIFRTPEISEWNSDEVNKNDIFLLVPFQDPGNMGTCLRTAAAFGIKKVILTKDSANPFAPRVNRAASGCHLSLQYFLTKDFKFSNIPVFGLDKSGIPLGTFSDATPFILAAGMEGKGIYKEIAYQKLFSIPMNENTESLNASIAVAVALYEITKK